MRMHGSRALPLAGRFGVQALWLYGHEARGADVSPDANAIQMQVREGCAESRCRCGQGEPSPGAGVGGVSPVPAQDVGTAHGTDAADVALTPSRRIDGHENRTEKCQSHPCTPHAPNPDPAHPTRSVWVQTCACSVCVAVERAD